MGKILIIQNITREMPGLLRKVLEDEGVDFDIVDLDKGQRLPVPEGYQAVVVLGGPDSANDDTGKIKSELDFIRYVLDAKVPYLGICLGLQLLVKAAGGRVVKNPVKESGFIDPDGNQYTVKITDEGKSDPLLTNLPEVLEVFQLHGETVEVTSTMKVLATGKFCYNQIVKVADNAYGVQSHVEVTPEMLAVWAEKDPDLSPIGFGKLESDFRAIEQSYTITGQTLLRNFLKICKLV
jgi:GMP synthase (glutamine-hydrolysing)